MLEEMRRKEKELDIEFDLSLDSVMAENLQHSVCKKCKDKMMDQLLSQLNLKSCADVQVKIEKF